MSWRGRIEIDPRKLMGKEGAIHGMAFWNQSDAELLAAYEAVGEALADLTLAQAAILAAIPQSPSSYDLLRNAVETEVGDPRCTGFDPDKARCHRS